ncbi:MAG: hypothetical protein J7M25_11030, partial [Deltaproteobacteria bacterium]|nr:hypothetical protein [Deltaproteobacteria bacterium]
MKNATATRNGTHHGQASASRQRTRPSTSTMRASTWTSLLLTALTGLLCACPATKNPNFVQADLPPDLDAEHGTVGLATKASLLSGPMAIGEIGDWELRNDRFVAIFRHEDGRLVDLGFRDQGKDLFYMAATTVTDTRGKYHVYYDQAKVLPAGTDGRGPGIEFWGRVRDRDLDLEVVTHVWAPPRQPKLIFTTTVRNASRRRVLRLGVGDDMYMGNSRLFVPGTGLVEHSSVLHASWVAREVVANQADQDWTISLVTGQGRPMRMKFSMAYPGFNPLVQATYTTADLETNDTLVVTRSLILTKGPLAQASAVIQHQLGGSLCSATIERPGRPAGRNETSKARSKQPAKTAGIRESAKAKIMSRLTFEIQAKGASVLRSALPGRKATVLLPKGPDYRVRLLLPGPHPGAWTDLKCGAAVRPPPPPPPP